MTGPASSTSGDSSSGNAKERLKLWLEHSPGLTTHFRSFHETLQRLSSGSYAASHEEPCDSSTPSDSVAA